MNRHHHAVLALCSGLAITGCTTVNASLTPISIDGAPAAAAAGTAIQIANLDIQTKAIIGAENFEAAYDIVRAGSGKIARYGLADPNGSVLLKPMFPIPVINNGHVRYRRDVYSGRRDTAPLIFLERQRQMVGPIFTLTVSGKF